MSETFRPVQSSQIKEADYDPLTGTLKVEFVKGGKFTYKNVPADIFDGLKMASSAGAFFHANVRDKFIFERG